MSVELDPPDVLEFNRIHPTPLPFYFLISPPEQLAELVS